MQYQSSYDLLKSRPENTLETFDIPQSLQYVNDQTQEFTTNRTPLARAHSASAQHSWNGIQRPQSSQGALYIPDIPSTSVTSSSAYIQQAKIDTSETRQGYWDASVNDATGSESLHPFPASGVADNVPRVQLPLIFDFGSSSYMPAASYSVAHGQIDHQQQQLDNLQGQEHQTHTSWDQVSTTLQQQQQQYGTFNLEDGETANGNILDLNTGQENGSCIAEFDKMGQSITSTARHFPNQQQAYHQRDQTPINFAARNAGGNAEWQQQVLYPMRSPVFAEDSISSIGPIQSFHGEMEITAGSPSSEKGEHGHGYGQVNAHSDSFASGNVEQVETAHATSRPSLDSEGTMSANSSSVQSHSSESAYGRAREGCEFSVESQTSASTGRSISLNTVNTVHGGHKYSLERSENKSSNVSYKVDQRDASDAKCVDSHGVPEVTKQNRRGRRPGNKEMTLEKRIKVSNLTSLH